MIEANLEALKRRRRFVVHSPDGTVRPVSQSAIMANTLWLADRMDQPVYPAEWFIPTFAPPKEPA